MPIIPILVLVSSPLLGFMFGCTVRCILSDIEENSSLNCDQMSDSIAAHLLEIADKA